MTHLKILHTENKTAKNGNKYRLVHVVIVIGDHEFVRRFAIFDKPKA